METNNHIDQLEAYAFGQLTEGERTALEARLREDPALQADLAAFQGLWTGFEGLAKDRLREQMDRWESEWEDIADDELAEWYWLEELSPENRSAVEARRATDTDFAELLTRQQTLNVGFTAAGKEDFRQRMERWTEKDETVSAKPQARMRTLYIRRLAAAAAIALLVFVGGRWYAGQQYGDEALAGRYYQAPAIGSTMGAQGSTEQAFMDAFTAAHQAFEQEDYLTAASSFAKLSSTIEQYDLTPDDRRYYLDNLEWSEVLALLGAHQLDDEFQRSLNAIAENSEHTYQAEASDLRAELGSFWRRW